jgi:16S rRNA processing protein RimM
VAERRVCVGVIAGAQGVRGAVRVKSFTEDPAALRDFAAITDEAGSPLALQVMEVRPRMVVARIDGVSDRDAAAALRGTKLYLDRTALPEPAKEEFYHADLIGLACETPSGENLGRVKAIHDFGAGDVIEIDGFDAMIPFTLSAVPKVDLAGERLVVIPPEPTE